MSISQLITTFTLLSVHFEASGRRNLAGECSEFANELLDEEPWNNMKSEIITSAMQSDPYFSSENICVYREFSKEDDKITFYVYPSEVVLEMMRNSDVNW